MVIRAVDEDDVGMAQGAGSGQAAESTSDDDNARKGHSLLLRSCSGFEAAWHIGWVESIEGLVLRLVEEFAVIVWAGGKVNGGKTSS